MVGVLGFAFFPTDFRDILLDLIPILRPVLFLHNNQLVACFDVDFGAFLPDILVALIFDAMG